MRFGNPRLVLYRRDGRLDHGTSKGAAAWADGPAPAGFRWQFVFDDSGGQMVRDDLTREPIAALVEN